MNKRKPDNFLNYGIIKVNNGLHKLGFPVNEEKMNNYKITFDNIEWQEATKGIRFKEMTIDNRKLKLVEFTDELYESDWCRKGHLGFVIKGMANVSFDNGEKTMFRAGDFINIPEGENDKHKTEIGKGERALIIFFDVL